MAHRLLLTVTDETSEYDGEEFIFDLVKSKSISKSVDITTHPLINGDLVGDHLYKQALTMQVNGTFSLNGSKYSTYYGEKDRLSNIQELFEKFMDSGTVLNLKTSDKDNNMVTRFLERVNMVLESINWTENYNSLDYTFGFKQIMFADIQEEPEKVLAENTLLALTDAVPLDFSSEIFNEEELAKIIMKIFTEGGLGTTSFWRDTNFELVFKNYLSAALIAIIGAIVVKFLIAAGVTIAYIATTAATATAISSAAGPIGWIALGVVAIVAVVGFAIWGIVKEANRRFKNINKFKFFRNSKKREKEEARFRKLFEYLAGEVKQIGNYMRAYDITSDQNQELLTYIDNNYYVFKFTRNNTTASENEKGYYSLEIVNVQGKTVSYGGKIDAIGHGDFQEAAGNFILKTDNNHYVYLMNKKIAEIKGTYTTNTSKTTSPALQQKLKEAQFDLRNFYILESEFEIAEFNNAVEDIIVNAMVNYDEE